MKGFDLSRHLLGLKTFAHHGETSSRDVAAGEKGQAPKQTIVQEGTVWRYHGQVDQRAALEVGRVALSLHEYIRISK